MFQTAKVAASSRDTPAAGDRMFPVNRDSARDTGEASAADPGPDHPRSSESRAGPRTQVSGPRFRSSMLHRIQGPDLLCVSGSRAWTLYSSGSRSMDPPKHRIWSPGPSVTKYNSAPFGLWKLQNHWILMVYKILTVF